MVGITSYGAYVPLWRLHRTAISSTLKGEKAIANFDEDSVTMAVAAATDCLNAVSREDIGGLLFASTTFPYREKQSAAIVAAACDLPRNISTADIANSLKGGTTALLSAINTVRSKAANQIMLTAADCRIGAPDSEFEQICGDGAAAIVVGDKDVAVSMEASYSISDEILGVWRTQYDRFIRTWEARFIAHNYLKVAAEAVTGLLQKHGSSPKDIAKAVFYSPDQRRAVELARSLGFDPQVQLQDTLIGDMGNTGTPYPLMLLIGALEVSKPGDLVLLCSYGDGADAMLFRVTENIEKLKGHRGMKRHLASKRETGDYRAYLKWRGLLDPATENHYPVPYGTTSAPALLRERNRILSLHGSRCKACSTVQFPPQRVCTHCHSKDQSEEVRLSDKRGRVFTFALDGGSSTVDSPVVDCVIDFEGGGRGEFCMTDRVVEDVKVGMEVEMSFRKLFFRENIYHYYWKAIPVRV